MNCERNVSAFGFARLGPCKDVGVWVQIENRNATARNSDLFSQEHGGRSFPRTAFRVCEGDYIHGGRLPAFNSNVNYVVNIIYKVNFNDIVRVNFENALRRSTSSHLSRSTLGVFSNGTAVAQSLGFGHRQFH